MHWCPRGFENPEGVFRIKIWRLHKVVLWIKLRCTTRKYVRATKGKLAFQI